MSETTDRERVIEVAKSWLGTPYHPDGEIKGIGVDCLRLVLLSYVEAGIIARPETLPHHPEQWAMNSAHDRVLEYTLAYSREVSPPPERVPLPADVVLMKRAEHKCFAHAGLVVSWPAAVLHVMSRETGVAIDSVRVLSMLGRTQMRFFSHW